MSGAPGEWSPGSVVGAYRLEQRLGTGGAGEVWRVTHLPTRAQRALKTLLPFADVEDRVRFLREAQALAALDGHPHVVRVHEVGESGSRAYLVMDLARPGDLNQRLKKGPLPEGEARELLAALASGLRHVHSHGLLHRDLKPHNVLFADDGRPLLSDFGLVRGPTRSSLSRSGEILGTPAYMAPEQALGEPLDERTDVYGLGAVLYHVLCGHPPFCGPTPLATLQQVIESAPQPPSKRAENVPPDLERVCLIALAKTPNDRYPGARALGDALSGSPPSRPGGAWAGVVIALALGLAGVAGLIGALARGTAELPSGERARPETVSLAEFLERLDHARVEAYLHRHPDRAAVESDPTHLKQIAESLYTAQGGSRETAAQRAAGVYAHYSREHVDGWQDFADFVRRAGADLGLPGEATSNALAVAMLEAGVEQGSKPCARTLGRLLETSNWGLSPDAYRTFALYCQGIPAFDEAGDHQARERHARTAYDLWQKDPASYEAHTDPERLLGFVLSVLGTSWSATEPEEAQLRLTDLRHERERRIGKAAFEELKAIPAEPSDWDAIRAFQDRDGASLGAAGQAFTKVARTEQNPALAVEAARRALLCYVRSIEDGEPEAWCDLGFLVRSAPWERFGSRLRQEALEVEGWWVASEEGNPRALASLACTYMTRSTYHEVQLERLLEVLRLSPQLELRALPAQRLKFVAAAAFFALRQPTRSPFPLPEVLQALKAAIDWRTEELSETLTDNREPDEILKAARVLEAELRQRLEDEAPSPKQE